MVVRSKKIKKQYLLSIGVGILLILILVVKSSALTDKSSEKCIVEFERNNPIFTLTVEPGTEKENLDIPDTVRGIMQLEELLEGYEFEVADPEIDEVGDYGYYQYGYVKMEDRENLYAVRNIRGEITYRTYGSLNGTEGWYVCDEDKNITGKVVAVSVAWDISAYQTEEGEYELEGTVTDYTYEGTALVGKVVVQQTNLSDSQDHEADSAQIEAGSGITPFLIPDEDKILSSEGSNDQIMNDLMEASLSTSGNEGYISEHSGIMVPGEWRDYIDTIWYNKAASKFKWTKDTSITNVAAGWLWDGTNGSASDSGTPDTAPLARPVKTGTTWTVYSGQQLRFAMENFISGDTISIARNIDLQGYEVNWAVLDLAEKDLILLGNGNTIYNLGIYKNGSIAAFLYNCGDLTLENLKFETAKMVINGSSLGLIEKKATYVKTYENKIENVEINSSLFYANADTVSPFGRICYYGADGSSLYMNQCSVENSYVYGRDHVAGFALGLGAINSTQVNGRTENSYTANNLLCGTGGHSAGFSSCMGDYFDIINCFAANEIYGSAAVSGFRGGPPYGNTINCYSTGRLEGYAVLGGFSFGWGGSIRNFTNCYSTTLVGLRSPAVRQGGFYSNTYAVSAFLARNFSNCYAAGEVGNFDTLMDGTEDIGGFFDIYDGPSDSTAVQKCYYDKQTTAMREWSAGNKKEVPGVTGLLTTTTDKAGTGMASGDDFGLGTVDWTYKTDHYPQLNVFANAASAIWGDRTDTVKAYSEASTATGYRPIRLISYMEIEAGEDQSIAAGTVYDHRDDVQLTMMDKLKNNMVIGFDNNKIWSSAIQGGYPDSDKYWAVPTTDMETDFTASNNAWIYSEIWVVKKNADGTFVKDPDNNYVADYSVKVTGDGTGNNDTLDEQKWNGQTPLYLDAFSHQKYLITYYWQLEDGRYRSDSKIVDIIPGQYNVTMDVFNTRDNTVNSQALSMDVQADVNAISDYNIVGQPAVAHTELTNQLFGTNVTAAWGIRKDLITIDRMEITLTGPGDLSDVEMGKAILYSVKAGDVITFDPVIYYYPAVEIDSQGKREVTKQAEVKVSYTIMEDGNGDFYLRFNKLLHPELSGSTDIGDSSGIVGAPDDLYINDLGFNTEIKLYVSEGIPFEFIKVNEEGSPMDGVEFTIYNCKYAGDSGHIHSNMADSSTDCCWDIENPKEIVVSGSSGMAGEVLFDQLSTGAYMLVETKTLSGYQLPLGQWLLTVEANWEVKVEARGEAPPAFIKETSDPEVILKLPNYRSFILPSTGDVLKLIMLILGISVIGGSMIYMILGKNKRNI